MTNYQSLLTASALSMLLMIMAATAPKLGFAAQASDNPVGLLTAAERVQVRASEERRLASLDKQYAKQQRKLAQKYKKLAKEVERQGDDATGLLAAAAYHESIAKEQEKKEKNENWKKGQKKKQ